MLAACLPSGTSDRFTLTKFIAVVFSIAGVVLVSLSDLKVEQSIPVGAGWALAGSMCYAAYLVLLKRRVDHEDKMSIPMFFGNHQPSEICKTIVSCHNFYRLRRTHQHCGHVANLLYPSRNQTGNIRVADSATVAIYCP